MQNHTFKDRLCENCLNVCTTACLSWEKYPICVPQDNGPLTAYPLLHQGTTPRTVWMVYPLPCRYPPKWTWENNVIVRKRPFLMGKKGEMD